MSQMRKSH